MIKKNYNFWSIILAIIPSCEVCLSQHPMVTIPSGYTFKGKLEYFNDIEVSVFKGIPYAEPPVGERRFRPSVLKEGPSFNETTSLITRNNPDPCLNAFQQWSTEDCLYLSVWTPGNRNKGRNSNDEAKQRELLPVMVYIHGGGFLYRTSYKDGRAFASNNVVVVTIQFRNHWLGNFNLNPIFGGKLVGDQDENLALDDQRVAMEWIQQNIEVFGGDPDNVSIYGWSSGAAFVMAHMASPPSQHLFHKAIVQSPSHIISSKLSTMISYAVLHAVILPMERLYKCGSTTILNVSCISKVGLLHADLEWWQNASTDVIREVMVNASAVIPDTLGSIAAGRGYSVPGVPSIVLEKTNLSSDKPMLIGLVMDEEYSLYPKYYAYPGLDANLPDCGSLDEDREKLYRTLLATDIIIEDPTNTDEPGRRESWSKERAAFGVVSEIVFGIPTQAMLEAHKGPTYSYIIEKPDNSRYFQCKGLGTSHGSDNKSIWGVDLESTDIIEIHHAWVNFMRTGAPGDITMGNKTLEWSEYKVDGSQYTMIISKNDLRDRRNSFAPERDRIAQLLLLECAILTPFGALFLRPVCAYNPVISFTLNIIMGRPNVKNAYQTAKRYVESRQSNP